MQFKQSPNYAKGPTNKLGFVLHGTLGNYAGAVQWLLTGGRDNPSSAHYVIGKKVGDVIQLVQNSDVAWHAGTVRNPLPRADYLLKRDITTGKYINPNQYLIGIEFEWFVGDTLTEWQYTTAMQIIKDSGIVAPILVDHHSICDYKTDDMYFAVQNITGRLASGVVKPATVITPPVTKPTIIQNLTVKPVHFFTCPLPYGVRSADVVYLQQILHFEGLMQTGQGAGGTYDDATASAVMALQLKHNIATPKEITQLAGKRVGQLTINYLNQTYGH